MALTLLYTCLDVIIEPLPYISVACIALSLALHMYISQFMTFIADPLWYHINVPSGIQSTGRQNVSSTECDNSALTIQATMAGQS